ncbi:MAG: hypothetical protein WD342_12700 [Verrucomicrobiales bacterium]
MKFKKAILNIGKIPDLKRVAGAYVIDHRGLTEDELREALIKTAPQYYNVDNVQKALEEIGLCDDRDVRTIGPALLSEILLNEDGFASPQRETEDPLGQQVERNGLLPEASPEAVRQILEKFGQTCRGVFGLGARIHRGFRSPGHPVSS